MAAAAAILFGPGQAAGCVRFASVGSLDGKQGVDDMQSLVAFLKNRQLPGLVVTAHVFEYETHESVLGPGISRALQVLYGVKLK